MSPVHRAKVLANGAWPAAVPQMPTPNLGQSRNCFRGYAKAVAFVVSCYVVDDGSEDGVKCKELVRHLWIWKLPNGMGVVAETQKRYDS